MDGLVRGYRTPNGVLRHTIMNPFLLDAHNGVSYIDMYFEFLERRIAARYGVAA